MSTSPPATASPVEELRQLVNTSDALESVFQKHLERNPQLLPREFLLNHGVHFDLVLRKPNLLGEYEADFLYLTKSSTQWRCIIVEIERPSCPVFAVKRTTSSDFTAGFQHAHGQVLRWKSLFDNGARREAFVAKLQLLLRPMPISANPVHFRYVLVVGRNREYIDDPHRAGILRALESGDTRILSWDSIVEAPRMGTDLYVGVLRNETLELRSPRYISDTLFSHVPAPRLRVAPSLKASIELNRNHWRTYSIKSDDDVMVLDEVLPKLEICEELHSNDASS